MLRLRLALPLVRRRLLDLRVRLVACTCSTLLAQDDTAGAETTGLCMQTGLFPGDHTKLLATSDTAYKGFRLVCTNGLVFPDSPVACDLTPVPTGYVR